MNNLITLKLAKAIMKIVSSESLKLWLALELKKSDCVFEISFNFETLILCKDKCPLGTSHTPL